jgi:hypothetical protein
MTGLESLITITPWLVLSKDGDKTCSEVLVFHVMADEGRTENLTSRWCQISPANQLQYGVV